MNIRHFVFSLVAMAFSITAHAANPIITEVFTADSAPLVYKGTVYFYVGQDEAKPDQHYVLTLFITMKTEL